MAGIRASEAEFVEPFVDIFFSSSVGRGLFCGDAASLSSSPREFRVGVIDLDRFRDPFGEDILRGWSCTVELGDIVLLVSVFIKVSS